MQTGNHRRRGGWSGQPRGRNAKPAKTGTDGRHGSWTEVRALGRRARFWLTWRLALVVDRTGIGGAARLDGAREQRADQGTKIMPGITPPELANLLDAGLEPHQISYLCFMRWRFRRGELNEGKRVSKALTMAAARATSGAVGAPAGRLTV